MDKTNSASQTADLVAPYADLSFPDPPAERPYICINMVATIDGKTVTGDREDNVMDLGSTIDHDAMRQIQDVVQAVIVGAGSMRATKGMWYPKRLFRFVVTRSGKLDFGSRFFSDAPERAFVVGPEALSPETPKGVRFIGCGNHDVDFVRLLQSMRAELGIERLLVEGGSELNAELLLLGVVDELFMTIAPKIKLGREVPTYAGGAPLTRQQILSYSLVSAIAVADEVFLRYRKGASR
jgi:riboflavin biosynthesis pyrimidine reductase